MCLPPFLEWCRHSPTNHVHNLNASTKVCCPVTALPCCHPTTVTPPGFKTHDGITSDCAEGEYRG